MLLIVSTVFVVLNMPSYCMRVYSYYAVNNYKIFFLAVLTTLFLCVSNLAGRFALLCHHSARRMVYVSIQLQWEFHSLLFYRTEFQVNTKRKKKNTNKYDSPFLFVCRKAISKFLEPPSFHRQELDTQATGKPIQSVAFGNTILLRQYCRNIVISYRVRSAQLV